MDNNRMIKSSILLVEDHEAFANALLSIVNKEETLNVVAVVGTAEEALEKLGELNIDLVLVDVSLPRVNGINLVAAIREKYPSLPCMMLSGHLSPEYVRRALDAGARGYMIKDNPAGILEGIQRVFNGGIYVSKELGEV
jgi:DNA-binding NarL/FixJ family response regulator